MSHIFISYARKDLDFASRIVGELAEKGLDTWIDWKSIPKGEYWEQEIYRGIEEADAFLFLLSPDSVRSQMCNKEIEHAVANSKRVLPIVIHETEVTNFLYETSRQEISKCNWIFCRSGQDNFITAIGEMLNTIQTDYEWLKYHTKLQVKALEWERSRYEKSFLLHGRELQDAELQLATNSNKEPYPTDLQREFVLGSRQTTDKQRRITTITATVGVFALAILAIFAFVQAGLKEEQATTTRAGELAAQSVALRDRNFPVSLLLGVEAFRTRDSVETRTALMDNLQANPQLQAYLSGHTNFSFSVAFSPDGKTLASGGDDYTIILWDVETRQPIGKPLKGHTRNVTSVSFSPDGKTLASGSSDNTVILWDVETGQPIGQPLKGHTDQVNSVAFSPDGKMLASTVMTKPSSYGM